MPSPAEMTSKLDKESICMSIEEIGRPYVEEVYVLPEIASTNSYLLGQDILPHKATICVAESQLSGRGRRGNSWHSTPGKNITLSISWGFARWPETITGLGLAAALVIAERLNKDYQIKVQIKWPNDLLVAGKKLAGILVDVSGESGGACNVVIGLGLNVEQAELATGQASYALQDLNSLGVKLNRNQFIGESTSDWVAMLRAYEQNGFAPLVERWNRLSSYANSSITVGEGTAQITGEMLGVDERGALLVKSKDGEVHVFADSNVSVRLVN
ncbi:MAG: biotin--[acetyl-CoA-carboxylase] ligase [Gammaproteobacteria bacterium]|nr:biotin--[acetyl-CoA-carboxylase] ligase [Gammaproteobacteria bacterium]